MADQYRLCPLEEPLTEECFRKTPLEFVRTEQELVWNNGSRLRIKGTFVDQGTIPAGSTWAMNPIPRIDFDSSSSGQPAAFDGCVAGAGGEPHDRPGAKKGCRQFDPPCEWDDGWYAQPPRQASVDVEGACSGDWTGGVIVDKVVVPAGLKPGRYVLGWRWDCEEVKPRPITQPAVHLPGVATPANSRRAADWHPPHLPQTSQIWASCADVKVVSAA